MRGALRGTMRSWGLTGLSRSTASTSRSCPPKTCKALHCVRQNWCPDRGRAAYAAPESVFLRILHVFKTYYPDTIGGVEQVIAQLACALNKRGYVNRIYT